MWSIMCVHLYQNPQFFCIYPTVPHQGKKYKGATKKNYLSYPFMWVYYQ